MLQNYSEMDISLGYTNAVLSTALCQSSRPNGITGKEAGVGVLPPGAEADVQGWESGVLQHCGSC